LAVKVQDFVGEESKQIGLQSGAVVELREEGRHRS